MPKRISGRRNNTCTFTKDLFKVYKIMHHYLAFVSIHAILEQNFFLFHFFVFLLFIQAKEYFRNCFAT